MGLDDEVSVLRQIPLFSNIDTAKLKLMCFASERLVFKSGEVLFRQGEAGDSAYILIAGEADVISETPTGPLTVATLKRNDIIGEIAILCDVPRTATIKAATELTALKVTKELFFRMIQDFPEMAVEIMRVLAQRLEATTAQLTAARAAAK